MKERSRHCEACGNETVIFTVRSDFIQEFGDPELNYCATCGEEFE